MTPLMMTDDYVVPEPEVQDASHATVLAPLLSWSLEFGN